MRINVVLMLINSSYQIIRHPDIQGRPCIGHNIHSKDIFPHAVIISERFRTSRNDKAQAPLLHLSIAGTKYIFTTDHHQKLTQRSIKIIIIIHEILILELSFPVLPMYRELKDKALRAALDAGTPSFYMQHGKELAESLSSYFANSLVRKCRSYLDESKLHPAHGLFHCEKVALEAGAILTVEGSAMGLDASGISELVLCVQIAGLLHDIKRAGNDHTIAGSKEAAAILKDFAIEERYKGYIVSAIRNHEAFKKVLDSDDESAKLISDSLYDADKFRWGPDNFTVTLWLIIESTGVSPEKLYHSFNEKMEGIKKIKKTFRTKTGQKYGPEFIDKGIMIGNEIYREMRSRIGGQNDLDN